MIGVSIGGNGIDLFGRFVDCPGQAVRGRGVNRFKSNLVREFHGESIGSGKISQLFLVELTVFIKRTFFEDQIRQTHLFATRVKIGFVWTAWISVCKGNFHPQMAFYFEFTVLESLFLELFKIAVDVAVRSGIVQGEVSIEFSVLVVLFVDQFTGPTIGREETVPLAFFEETGQKLQPIVLPKDKRSILTTVSETNLKVFLTIGVIITDECLSFRSVGFVRSQLIEYLRSVFISSVFDVIGVECPFGAGAENNYQSNRQKAQHGGFPLS